MLQMTNWRLRRGTRRGTSSLLQRESSCEQYEKEVCSPSSFTNVRGILFQVTEVTFCVWQKRLTEIVTKLVGIKKERMWTMSSTLIWSLTIQFFTKTKAPVHAGRERAAEISLHLAQGSPSSECFGHLALPGPRAARNCQFWVFTKNHQHLRLRVSTEPDSLQWMKSPLEICHITSLTIQRFSDPLSQSVVDLHMGNLWLLTPQ